MHTINDLFARLAKEPISAKEKEGFSDRKRLEQGFDPIDHYIANTYQQEAILADAKKRGIDMSLKAIRARLAAKITWKRPGASLNDVTREFHLAASQPTNAQRGASWDSKVTFYLFIDDDGRVLGWYARNQSPGFGPKYGDSSDD